MKIGIRNPIHARLQNHDIIFITVIRVGWPGCWSYPLTRLIRLNDKGIKPTKSIKPIKNKQKMKKIADESEKRREPNTLFDQTKMVNQTIPLAVNTQQVVISTCPCPTLDYISPHDLTPCMRCALFSIGTPPSDHVQSIYPLH